MVSAQRTPRGEVRCGADPTLLFELEEFDAGVLARPALLVDAEVGLAGARRHRPAIRSATSPLGGRARLCAAGQRLTATARLSRSGCPPLRRGGRRSAAGASCWRVLDPEDPAGLRMKYGSVGERSETAGATATGGRPGRRAGSRLHNAIAGDGQADLRSAVAGGVFRGHRDGLRRPGSPVTGPGAQAHQQQADRAGYACCAVPAVPCQRRCVRPRQRCATTDWRMSSLRTLTIRSRRRCVRAREIHRRAVEAGLGMGSSVEGPAGTDAYLWGSNTTSSMATEPTASGPQPSPSRRGSERASGQPWARIARKAHRPVGLRRQSCRADWRTASKPGTLSSPSTMRCIGFLAFDLEADLKAVPAGAVGHHHRPAALRTASICQQPMPASAGICGPCLGESGGFRRLVRADVLDVQNAEQVDADADSATARGAFDFPVVVGRCGPGARTPRVRAGWQGQGEMKSGHGAVLRKA